MTLAVVPLFFFPACSWCRATVLIPTISNTVYHITRMPAHVHMHTRALASSVFLQDTKNMDGSTKHFFIVLLVVENWSQYIEIKQKTVKQILYSDFSSLPVFHWLSTFLLHVSNESSSCQCKVKQEDYSWLCVLERSEWCCRFQRAE